MKPLTPEENTKLINEITKELQQEEALEKGKFSVVSIIGHGTFGVVYRAKSSKYNKVKTFFLYQRRKRRK